MLWNQGPKYLYYLSSKLFQCEIKLWRFSACLGGCWTCPPPTCCRRRPQLAAKRSLSSVFLLLTLFGLKSAEKHLFWLPRHDKDSTKQAFGSHASWIPYFVLNFVHLHLAWPRDPKAAWQVSCCCDKLFHFIKPPFGEHRWANIQVQRSFFWIFWMDFKWMSIKTDERCWCRTRHKGAHLSVVAVRDTNRGAPGEKNSCCVLQWFKCLMLVPKDTGTSLKSAVMHEMTKKIYIRRPESE